jgi:type I restriction enzyme, R subunit
MNESEWLTRKTRIDKKLRSLNPAWEIIRYREGLSPAQLRCHAVTEFPTQNGPADYALFVNGILLGILEAKKVTVSPQNVLEQAKRYSSGIIKGCGSWNGHQVPFLFATNGEIIWFLDVRGEKAASRKLNNFHTGPALESLFQSDHRLPQRWLLDTPVERIGRLRDY